MNKYRLVNWLLALALALGPVQSALAEALGATHEHHHNAVTQDIAAHGDAAHADVDADQDSGHDHEKGHNHATCGSACMAAMVSNYSLTTDSISMLYIPLTIPVTGMIFPPHVRPPQVSS
jgi:hypothetical protein